MYNGNAQIGETVGLYDVNDQLTGYSVSFISNGQPDGYIILNPSLNGKPITEYALSGEDTYSLLENDVQSTDAVTVDKNSTHNLPKRLYNPSPLEYGIDVSTDKGSYVFDTRHSLISKDTYKSDYSGSHVPLTAVFQPSLTLSNVSGHAITDAYLYTPLLMGNMPSDYNDGKTAGQDGEQNCGPTCLTNIVCYYQQERGKSNLVPNNNIPNTYTALRNYCLYSPTGGTLNQSAGPAIQQYCKGQGYTCLMGDNIGGNLAGDWTNYTQTLASNIPIMSIISGYTSSTSTSTESHFIVTVGYDRLSDQSTWLEAYDEWDARVMYLRVGNGTPLTGMQGYSVSIS